MQMIGVFFRMSFLTPNLKINEPYRCSNFLEYDFPASMRNQLSTWKSVRWVFKPWDSRQSHETWQVWNTVVGHFTSKQYIYATRNHVYRNTNQRGDSTKQSRDLKKNNLSACMLVIWLYSTIPGICNRTVPTLQHV